MRRLIPIAILCSFTMLTAGEAKRETVTFERQVKNLRVVSQGFVELPGSAYETGCDSFPGTRRFGKVPHRLVAESSMSTAHFVVFQVFYPESGVPTVLFDLNQDRRLDCKEVLPMVEHPWDKSRLVRTFTLPKGDGASQRYRLTLPTRLDDSGRGEYFLDFVDVPVARWTNGEEILTLLLFDGNHDGAFSTKFGDGLLVDHDRDGVLDLKPYSGDFVSFSQPLETPWGQFRTVRVDTKGEAIILEPVASPVEPFAHIGDPVGDLSCLTVNNEVVSVAERSGDYVVLFFWLSTCGACLDEMLAISPLIADVPSVHGIGVSLDESRQGFDEFVATTRPDWPQCFSGKLFWDNELASRFKVSVPGDFVLIGPDGRYVANGNGAKELRQTLEALPAAANTSA